MVEPNNPAGRLFIALDATRSAATHSGPQPALHTWCNFWGLDPGKRAHTTEAHRLGQALMDAAVLTRRLGSELEGSTAQIGLRKLDQVDNCVQFFPLMARVSNEEFFQYLNEDGMTGLELLSDLLGASPVQEGVIDPEKRQELIDQVRALRDQVRTDDTLSAEYKSGITDDLNHVEWLLARTEVMGGAEVQRAVDGIVGRQVRLIGTYGPELIAHPITKAMLALAGSVAGALGITADYLAVAEAFNLPLPGPAQAP